MVEPTGADTYVVVSTAAGDVTVRVAPQTRVQVGDAVRKLKGRTGEDALLQRFGVAA